MTENKSLSDKIDCYNPADDPHLINVEDLKQSIKELKEELRDTDAKEQLNYFETLDIIDKIFGDFK